VLSWEERFGVVKIAPLVNWSAGKVQEYVRERGIPLNPLLGRGYKSIGCAPCTRPVSEGEEPGRVAGRAWTRPSVVCTLWEVR
jgi:phosphoadenosine phosphosulfate reductase